MTTQTFDLPDLGEGLTEAEVVRWLVAVGDTVAVDQPVVEVETAKSVVEVPTPYGGTVSALYGAEGEVVAVGSPLISIASGDREPVSPEGERYREEERAGTGSGNVLIGYGTPEAQSAGRRRRPRRRPPARPTAPAAPSARHVPLVTSPLVRQMAREAGLRVADIQGTGPNGLVTRRDVAAAVAAAATPAPAPEPASAPHPGASGAVDPRTGLTESARTPMSGFRRSVAEALGRSRREIPEATVWVDVDATELVRLRAARPDGPGLLAYVARFTVAALRAHPELNGRVDGGDLVQYDGVNLGLAVQTDRGLVAPAVLDAHRLTTAGLDAEIRRLTKASREGRATPAEMTGGTFTLNNYGSLRVDGSAAIINHPQVAILGLGRIIDRPWVVDGELTVRKIAQLSFAFDHRVCDGGTAAGFMRVVADAIEDPAAAIAVL
ncbi:dihydrolipoamide acetyltransferase family protein [Nocardiopsis algeriensis]|uniref:dihydrolipoamide acetyltransferase family protein n=1 Tax=Nocardiopsis algeriensis TaxID=1478215 RepID=UPI003B42AE05